MKLTYDDFLLFPDDGKRHELIDGEHYVTPSPNTRHQRISGRFYFRIGNWLEGHPIGQLFYAPFDVVFSNFDVVEPDLLYMSNARAAKILTAKHVAGVPEARDRDRLARHAQARRDAEAPALRAHGGRRLLDRRSRYRRRRGVFRRSGERNSSARSSCPRRRATF